MTRAFVPALPDPGVYRLSLALTADAACARAHASGAGCWTIDLSRAAGRVRALRAFDRALGFPPWWGRNWDALYDLLGDESWLRPGLAGLRVLVVVGAGAFERRDPRAWEILIDILRDATASAATSDAPLLVLLRGWPGSARELPEWPAP